MATLKPMITFIPSGTSSTGESPAAAKATNLPGRPVADVLAQTDEDGYRIYLNPANIAKMRALGQLPGNDEFQRVAERGYFTVDVSTLKDHDTGARVQISVNLTPANDTETRILQG
jgi:hypothetical protein